MSFERVSFAQRNKALAAMPFLAGLLILAAVCMPNLKSVSQLPVRRPQEPVTLATPVQQFEISSRNTRASFLGAASASGAAVSNRKIVQTGSVELTVKDPKDSAEKVRSLVQSLGGYVEASQIEGQKEVTATVTIRVPASRLDEAKADLGELALHVDNEKTNAQDVSRQYVDTEARLRNLRAQEGQYLQIMKSAVKVQDMLDVSEHLSQVRGEIEQEQADFQILSKQIEMATLVISLKSAIAPVTFGLNWRPLYQLKLASQQALDGIAEYASTMMSVLLYLPVLLLWGVTILLAVAAGWRILRWTVRTFFRTPAAV
jgi:hypothetical protein